MTSCHADSYVFLECKMGLELEVELNCEPANRLPGGVLTAIQIVTLNHRLLLLFQVA